MANADKKLVKNQTNERVKAFEIRASKLEMKDVHFLIANLKELVKIVLNEPQLD